MSYLWAVEQVEVICPSDLSEGEPVRDKGGLLGVGCEIVSYFVGAIGGLLSIGCEGALDVVSQVVRVCERLQIVQHPMDCLWIILR